MPPSCFFIATCSDLCTFHYMAMSVNHLSINICNRHEFCPIKHALPHFPFFVMCEPCVLLMVCFSQDFALRLPLMLADGQQEKARALEDGHLWLTNRDTVSFKNNSWRKQESAWPWVLVYFLSTRMTRNSNSNYGAQWSNCWVSISLA